MYAVIESGGKQYKVKKGATVYVDKLGQEQDDGVEFDKVLLIAGEGDPLIGKPYLDNALVTGSIVKEFKDKKIVVFKFKRKTGYQRKKGHRQWLTQVKIDEILTDKSKKPARKVAVKPVTEVLPEAVEKKAEPKAAHKAAPKAAATVKKEPKKAKAESADNPKKAKKNQAEER